MIEGGKIEAVARCLAKMDGEFISATDWADTDRGEAYRDQAQEVLNTIENYDAGVRSGGLPA